MNDLSLFSKILKNDTEIGFIFASIAGLTASTKTISAKWVKHETV